MARSKSSRPKRTAPRDLGPHAAKRIAAGEPWLRVWSQQLNVPVAQLLRRTSLPLARLMEIERGDADATDDELAEIAAALGTTPDMIKAARGHPPAPPQ